jgi:hypothetical protein
MGMKQYHEQMAAIARMEQRKQLAKVRARREQIAVDRERRAQAHNN